MLHHLVRLIAWYVHLSAAFVIVEQLRWARIKAAAGHKPTFWRDGTEKRFVEVE